MNRIGYPRVCYGGIMGGSSSGGGGGGGGQTMLTAPDMWAGQLPDLPAVPSAPTPVAPPPVAADPSVQNSKDEELARTIRQQRPLMQTILTSGMGDARVATTKPQRLLGA